MDDIFVERFWSKVQKTDTHWLWLDAPSTFGYGIFRTGERGQVTAHRVSWELHYGPLPEGERVRHYCDNKLCVNPEHLRLSFTAEELFWMNVQKTETCWLWTGSRSLDGYGKFNHGPRSNSIVYRAHRFSWELHHGPIPEELYVCHNCPDGDNPLCVNPEHLWLGTTLENTQDYWAKKRGTERLSPPRNRQSKGRLRGEQQHFSKLTEAAIREIRTASRGGTSSRELARQYGVSRQNIMQIVTRKTWKHVP